MGIKRRRILRRFQKYKKKSRERIVTGTEHPGTEHPGTQSQVTGDLLYTVPVPWDGKGKK
jgi:hypothetical protein